MVEQPERIRGNRSGISGVGLYKDYWVVKTDKEGEILWDKTIGGADDDYLTCAMQSPEGSGFILGGLSSSPQGAEKSENNLGGVDMWVVGLPNFPQAQVKWDKTIGGPPISRQYGIAYSDVLGTYFLVGHATATTKPVGDKTFPGYKLNDAWVVELQAPAP
jgi:hypothetical protein